MAVSPLAAIPSGLPSGFDTPVVLVGLLLASLLLIFLGRRVIRAAAFILGGLGGVYFGGLLGVSFLGSLGAILGEVAGFLLGGFLGMSFLSLAMGLALAYVGYAVTQAVLNSTLASIVVGIGLFIIGQLLAGRILTLVSVVLGGFLLLNVLTLMGFQLEVALVATFILSSLGIWIQSESAKRMRAPAP